MLPVPPRNPAPRRPVPTTLATAPSARSASWAAHDLFQPTCGPGPFRKTVVPAQHRRSSRRYSPDGPGRKPNPFQDSPAGALARARRPAQPAPPPVPARRITRRPRPRAVHSAPPSARRTPPVGGPWTRRRGMPSSRRILTAAADVGAEQRTMSAVPRNVRRKRGTAGRGRPVEPGKRDRTSPAGGAPRGTPGGAPPDCMSAGPPRAATSAVPPTTPLPVACRAASIVACRVASAVARALVAVEAATAATRRSCTAFSSLARPAAGEDWVRRWPPARCTRGELRRTKRARWTSPAPGRRPGRERAPSGRE